VPANVSIETRLATTLERDGGIKMHVNAPPPNGKANREIVKWLSRALGTSNSQIRIVATLTSNLKVIAIVGMNENGFLEAIRQRHTVVS
jgi:uncharacterized protein YggU (UPF0235/DUF167 family)